jgi:hypothetical protein
MKTLWMVLLILPAAFGTPFVPQPITSEICSIAGQSVACDTDDGVVRLFSLLTSHIQGIGTSDGITINVTADAGFSYRLLDNTGIYPTSSVANSISLDFLGSTEGPERQGFATFSIDAVQYGKGGAGFGSVSIEGAGGCGSPFCQPSNTTIPFMLGRAFDMDLLARASAEGSFLFFGGAGGGGGTASLSLRVFEADGTPVAIFALPSSVSAVPEPQSWMLAGIGLAVLLLSRAKFRSRTVRSRTCFLAAKARLL